MNLIEELGIEKARAIVDGAPKHAEYYSPLSYSNKYKKSVRDNTYEPDVANGYTKSYDFWDGRKWNGCACMLEHLDDLILISSICTAIAEHDQNLSEQRERFEKAYSLKFPESKVTLLPNGNYSGWIKQKKWKDWQAKQEQLQTELNNCSKKDSSEISITDDCTDIRNHISPLTGVIER